MTEIIIKRPEFLAAASLFTSKDMCRYYINGVMIEPAPQGGVFLVATDGHRLAVFHDPEGMADAPHIVNVSKRLFDACKFQSKRTNPEFMADDEYIHLYDDNKRIDVQIFSEIEGDFPDWRKVLPRKPSGVQGGPLDHHYVSEFQKLISTAYGRGYSKSAIRLMQNGDGPTIIFHTEKDWFGLIMPMRTDIVSDYPFQFSKSADDDEAPSEGAAVAAE